MSANQPYTVGKTGIGYITCNNEARYLQTMPLIPDLGVCIVINDGQPYTQVPKPAGVHWVQHETNQGVGKSKNEALRWLMEQGCEHLFLIEDDVIVRDAEIFQIYIQAAQETGILHFNYALQGPHNRKQNIKMPTFWQKVWRKCMGKTGPNAADRVHLDPLSAPDPRLEKDYARGTRLRLYRNCAGALSYYHREVIEKVGYMDEQFKNAWEHVHHTYKIIQAGMHPPFWWFADVAQSEYMLDNTADCIAQSTIAKSEKWLENVEWGAQYFKKMEGYKPGDIPDSSEKKVLSVLTVLQESVR